MVFSTVNVILRVVTLNFNLKLGKSRTLYNSFRVYRNMLLLIVVRSSSMYKANCSFIWKVSKQFGSFETKIKNKISRSAHFH